jgi:hypothetical protein
MMYGPMAACLSELFGTRVRYTGASLAYQLTSVFSGGVAPLISTYLLARYGSGAVAAYIAGCCAITLIAASLAPETHRTDLDDARRRHRRDRRSPRVSNSCDAGGAERIAVVPSTVRLASRSPLAAQASGSQHVVLECHDPRLLIDPPVAQFELRLLRG